MKTFLSLLLFGGLLFPGLACADRVTRFGVKTHNATALSVDGGCQGQWLMVVNNQIKAHFAPYLRNADYACFPVRIMGKANVRENVVTLTSPPNLHGLYPSTDQAVFIYKFSPGVLYRVHFQGHFDYQRQAAPSVVEAMKPLGNPLDGMFEGTRFKTPSGRETYVVSFTPDAGLTWYSSLFSVPALQKVQPER